MEKYVIGSLAGSPLSKCDNELLMHPTVRVRKTGYDSDEDAISLTKLSASRLKHDVLHTLWSVRYTRFRDLHEDVRHSNHFIASLIGNDSRTRISLLPCHLFLQGCFLGKRSASMNDVVHAFKLRGQVPSETPSRSRRS